ncbi:MAG TPA: Gfo/Idh/MocA family oxidoreductase [Bryobacteraceae bacterium]|nr:Gfo/Idh/MocA family oxidoreductase [Bryobacteraceae bacterium]
MKRRDLLAASLWPAARVLGANERVNVVLVGLGGRGLDHARAYAEVPAANIAGICDVSQAARERGAALVEKLTGRKPKEYKDMRAAFADKDVDAVSMATPNHWHALGAVWACQAGKDVYCEKPASHNLFEGRQMIAAARKYGRMVQVGAQSRSIAHKREAVEFLQKGGIGKVYLAKGLCYKRRKSIGKKPDQAAPPPGVDWDQFLGPAPLRPFNENRFLYNWHWFWDTGNGDIGNQGVHEMDVARWGLGKSGPPRSVYSFGGKFLYDDDQETPNTQSAVFDYGDALLEFEVRGLLSPEEGKLPFRNGNTIGNVFFGSEGLLVMDQMGYQVYKGESHTLVSDVKFKEPRAWDTTPHVANFVQTVKSRKKDELNGEIAIGAGAAALCHMANISYRTGRKLTVDSTGLSFVGDPEANRLTTRIYRKPYTVPEKV